MNPIESTIAPGQTGSAVSNFQECLRFLLEKKPDAFAFSTPESAQSLSTKIEQEQSSGKFEDATLESLRRFQKANQLEVTSAVDQPTADALNKLLEGLGAFATAQQGWVVQGQVVDAAGQPVSKVEVLAFDRELGDARQQLDGRNGRHFTDADGRFQIAYTLEQFAAREGQAPSRTITPDLVFELRRNEEVVDKVQIIR